MNVAAIFVDIRDSSSLIQSHNRPIIAKIYRSFISEVVAIINGSSKCHEINIIGDCVSAVFSTPFKRDIDHLVEISYKINSIIKILNCKLRKKGYTTIKVGVGIDYGRALMIKAGHKYSEINDIVWMGEVVNYASKLGKRANGPFEFPIFISNVIYSNLSEKNKALFTKNYSNDCYSGNVVNISMNDWYKENCQG